MEDRDEIILINFPCVLLIVISLVAAFGIGLELINWNFFMNQVVNLYGKSWDKFLVLKVFANFIFYLLLAICSYLAFRRRELGRKITITLSCIGIVLPHIYNWTWQLLRHNDSYLVYTNLASLQVLNLEQIVFISVVYLLTRTVVKERFK